MNTDFLTGTGIAHGLSHVPRFAGQTAEFYSVAQHSVAVANRLPPPMRLLGLLHDAAEAYLGDVPAPAKQLVPEFRALEHRLLRAIYRRFDLSPRLVAAPPQQLKVADQLEMLAERRDLLPPTEWWPIPTAIACPPLRPLNPRDAEALFLERYATVRGAPQTSNQQPPRQTAE